MPNEEQSMIYKDSYTHAKHLNYIIMKIILTNLFK